MNREPKVTKTQAREELIQLEKNYLFIDDSGSKDWDTPYARTFVVNPPQRNSDNIKFWRQNYFVLAGVYVKQTALANINPMVNSLKEKTFGTKNVEIKSEWLRNPYQRKKRYIDKFGITEDKLKDFIENKWYGVFEENTKDIRIFSFVIDKRCYNAKRNDRTPLQELAQVLFDRVEIRKNGECDIIFDQMEKEIKSEKHRQGEILKISSKEIDLGSFQEGYTHTKPVFEKSCNSNFLQFADTVAYNVWRQFVDFGDQWDDPNRKRMSLYTYLSRLTPNFYKSGSRIAGFGIVKVPDIGKKKWGC